MARQQIRMQRRYESSSVFEPARMVSASTRWAGSGPRVSPEQVAQEYELTSDALWQAIEMVPDLAGFDGSGSWQRMFQRDELEVSVVNRHEWIAANAGLIKVIADMAVQRITTLTGQDETQLLSPRMSKVLHRVVGTVFGFMSRKVLGQFDSHVALDGVSRPTLMMVAPNIMLHYRKMDVDADQVRLWVGLHEVAHVAQQHMAPWLDEYLGSMIADVLAYRYLASVGDADEKSRAQHHEQRIGAMMQPLMTLLEGHANYVMDAVSDVAVLDTALLRQRHEASGGGWFDAVWHRALGADAKQAQYHEGQRFVETVIERVGIQEFNKVWLSSGMLPTQAEIQQPHQWDVPVLGQAS